MESGRYALGKARALPWRRRTLAGDPFSRKAFRAMKVDGHCLCGYLSYEAQVDENLGRDLQLHGLPGAVRFCISRERSCSRRTVQVSHRRTEDVCENRRERQPTHPGFLPGMRKLRLFEAGRRQERVLRATGGITPPKSPIGTARAILAPVGPKLDSHHWRHENVRNTIAPNSQSPTGPASVGRRAE